MLDEGAISIVAGSLRQSLLQFMASVPLLGSFSEEFVFSLY